MPRHPISKKLPPLETTAQFVETSAFCKFKIFITVFLSGGEICKDSFFICCLGIPRANPVKYLGFNLKAECENQQ